ncbi:MAG: hypothetical protein IPK83_13140 [Planctomycetes bacterium]|nr:hypothetical protein [Planctomycetota bacterium]
MNDPSDSLPFIVDAVGRFAPSQVHVANVQTDRPSTPALDELIAAEWDRRLSEAKRTNGLLFNGPMLRYVAHEVRSSAAEPDRLHLTVGPTCYRDFVGTNLFNHHRMAEFGWHTFANPIGTTATLITSDNIICYGVRSASVAYHASHVHTFGGSFEQRDCRPDGRVDPFASLMRELTEELNLQARDLHNLHCVGLIRDKEIHQPEMLFEANVGLSSQELLARWESAEAKDEHAGLVTLKNAPEAIIPFIKRCGLIAPVAIGALFLHGKLTWGDDWYAQASRNADFDLRRKDT